MFSVLSTDTYKSVLRSLFIVSHCVDEEDNMAQQCSLGLLVCCLFAMTTAKMIIRDDKGVGISVPYVVGSNFNHCS